jgi:uncharacterized protein (TIGR00730 family)
MRELKRICIYCGSSNSVAERYFEVARQMGHYLAGRHIGVVYGGGNVGLMGVLADAVIESGGEIIGVIPQKLMELDLAHSGTNEMHIVKTMHQRKEKMARLSDAFIAMPGGWGTLEEIFEATTWTQLEYHHKPVGILNAHGYYDLLLGFLDHAGTEGFIRPAYRTLIQSAADPEELVGLLENTKLPHLGRLRKELPPTREPLP